MRTTVEMKPEHRSALLALASRRGHKGFSTVLGEAIESFLQGEAERDGAVQVRPEQEAEDDRAEQRETGDDRQQDAEAAERRADEAQVVA